MNYFDYTNEQHSMNESPTPAQSDLEAAVEKAARAWFSPLEVHERFITNMRERLLPHFQPLFTTLVKERDLYKTNSDSLIISHNAAVEQLTRQVVTLKSQLEKAEGETERLRDSLANAKGWILANTTKPVHGLIESINSALTPAKH